MDPLVKNILVVVGGIVIGSIVNFTLVNLNGTVIPFPEGVDVSSMDKMAKTMHLF